MANFAAEFYSEMRESVFLKVKFD